MQLATILPCSSCPFRKGCDICREREAGGSVVEGGFSVEFHGRSPLDQQCSEARARRVCHGRTSALPPLKVQSRLRVPLDRPNNLDLPLLSAQGTILRGIDRKFVDDKRQRQGSAAPKGTDGPLV